MFFRSQSILTTALNLMVNHTEKLQLMTNIYEAFKSVDPKTIDDVYIRKLFETCRSFSQALMDKGIRSNDQAKIYLDNSNLDEDIKSIIKEDTYFSDEVINDYIKYFARVKYHSQMKKSFDSLEESWSEYQTVGVSDIQDYTDNFLEASSAFDKLAEDLRKDTSVRTAFMLNPTDVDNSFGITQLEEDIDTSSRIKLQTGIWIDKVTGGGFKAKSLYLVASISGGFKSGFMQNVAEYMSMANDPATFKCPTGVQPVILYINLEMSQSQMLARRLAFYNMDQEYFLNNPAEIKTSMVKRLQEKGSRIPVIYQKEEDRRYTAQQLRTDIKKYSKDGFKVVAVVADYSDLFKYVPQISDEIERISPLVRKNEDLRSIARELNIPILSAVQLNRASSELKKRQQIAHKEDILKYITSDTIAKSFDIMNVPEQFYFCYKFPSPNGDEYFSLIVEKDRDNNAKFIDKNGNEIKSKLNRVHYVSKLDGIRITNDYEDTITKYEAGNDSIITEISLSAEELAAFENDENDEE